MRQEWIINNHGTFGSCIKNDKLSPDKCVSIGKRCDHGVRMVDDCDLCEARYIPPTSDERTPGFIATHPTITMDINRQVDLLSIHKSINDARIGNLVGFMLEYAE